MSEKQPLLGTGQPPNGGGGASGAVEPSAPPAPGDSAELAVAELPPAYEDVYSYQPPTHDVVVPIHSTSGYPQITPPFQEVVTGPTYQANGGPPAPGVPAGDVLAVACEGCQKVVTYPRGRRIVRCSCQYMTPVMAPPPSKKYFRCACRTLCTVSVNASAVRCPRCRATTIIGPPPLGQRRARCGGCNTLVVAPVRRSAAVCPVCRVSVIFDPLLFGRRMRRYTVLGFVLVAIGIGVTLGVSAGTDDTFGPVEVLGAVPIVLGAIFLLIALVMFSRKKSEAIPEA